MTCRLTGSSRDQASGYYPFGLATQRRAKSAEPRIPIRMHQLAELCRRYGVRKLALAVERLLGVIGEATRRVSETTRREHPEVPWRAVTVPRVVLAHEYGDVDHERLWELISVHVPPLISTLQPIIPPLPPEER